MLATAFLLANCKLAWSRTQTSTGLPMALKCPPAGTNSLPAAHWHTIRVPPAPGLPKIPFYDKLNPVWWLENADDPIPPAWYRPGDPHRGLKWSFRNPFHNFDHYVIGIADKTFERSGLYPERNSNPHGGWDLELARRRLARTLCHGEAISTG